MAHAADGAKAFQPLDKLLVVVIPHLVAVKLLAAAANRASVALFGAHLLAEPIPLRAAHLLPEALEPTRCRHQFDR